MASAGKDLWCGAQMIVMLWPGMFNWILNNEKQQRADFVNPLTRQHKHCGHLPLWWPVGHYHHVDFYLHLWGLSG